MNVNVFANGEIDMRFRQYVNREETQYNTFVWDPNTPYEYGLYSGKFKSDRPLRETLPKNIPQQGQKVTYTNVQGGYASLGGNWK